MSRMLSPGQGSGFVTLAAMAILCAGTAAAQELPPLAKGSDWLRQWDGVELTLSSHTGPTTDAVAEMVKEFEAITGAKVEVIAESWTDLLSKHLADAAAGGGTYDVLTWPYLWSGHYVEGGLVENLNPWLERTDLVDPNLDVADIPEAIVEVYGRYRGGASPDSEGLWSLPYKFDVYVAQWRPDLFKEAGLVDEAGNPRPPATWEQLLTDAEVLAAKFPDMQPLAFPLAVDDPMVSTFLPILASYTGTVPNPWYDENTYPIFQSEAGQQALQVLAALVKFMPADALSMDFDMVNAQMAQGRAAYAVNWNAYLPVLLDPGSSQVSDKVAFAPTPGGPGGQFSGLGGWTMGISTQSDNKEAAFQLIQFIGGRDRAVEFAMAGGSVARNSVAETPTVVEAFPYYPVLMEALKGYAARGKDRAWADVQRTLGVGLSEAILSEADAKTAMTAIAGTVFDQMQQAGYTPEATGARP